MSLIELLLWLPDLFLLPCLRIYDWPFVHMASSQDVICHAYHGSGDEHDTRPVEALDSHADLIRPERPEECERGVEQCTSVDCDSPSAQAPLTFGQECRVVDAAIQNAADRDHVCPHKTDKVEGDDGVAV
jgi:hypothetical protein